MPTEVNLTNLTIHKIDKSSTYNALKAAGKIPENDDDNSIYIIEKYEANDVGAPTIQQMNEAITTAIGDVIGGKY